MSVRPSTSSSHLPPTVVPTVPAALHSLSTPTPLLVDSQLPAYLLPSVIDLLRDSTAHVIRKKQAEEDALIAEGLLPPKGKEKASEGDKSVQDELVKRIERIGLMVGGFVAEKLTIARPPLASHLDIIKFICKDLFLAYSSSNPTPFPPSSRYRPTKAPRPT
ncbi:hypothetical protein P7C73_g6886, partial [Tremellales sp. Uapishka_1]